MPLLATQAIASARGFGFTSSVPFRLTISANQTNANLRTLAINAGWNQSAKLIATINSGIYISSATAGTPALTVSGSFPGGVELTNNGFIVGRGGNGGTGPSYGGAGTAGSAGTLALSVSSAITIRNNNTIAGGGGGGGGGQSFNALTTNYRYAGGGGGGGRSSAAANSAGGAAGTGQSGGYGGGQGPAAAGGAGTVSAAGTGGTGSYDQCPCGGNAGGGGGNGGNWGAAGASGFSGFSITGQNTINGPYGGGSGGGAVSGNANITWAAFGTRLGGIS